MHILFFSEVQVIGFSTPQLLQAISQRAALEPCINLRGHNILNAQIFNQKILLLSYTSQTPFLSIYDLITNECKQSGIARVQMFTEESCSRCLDAPGSLLLLDNYVIFNFSRNSALFACEIAKIGDLDTYLQLSCQGICAPMVDRHQLWVFEKSFLYMYNTDSFIRPVGRHDLGRYEVHGKMLKEMVLPPLIIDSVRIHSLGYKTRRKTLIISLTSKYCFEIDVEKKQLTLLTPLLTREESFSGCYTNATQFLFYTRETINGKLIVHSLHATLGRSLSSMLSLPIGHRLYTFEAKHQYDNQGPPRSLRDSLKEAVLDKELQEAIEACRPDSSIGMTPTQKASVLRTVIRRVAKKHACDQNRSSIREAEAEQELRKLLHRYAERKLHNSRHAQHHGSTKGVYIGSSDNSGSRSEPVTQVHVSTYIVSKACTRDELAVARYAYKQSLFCSAKGLCSLCFTHTPSSCTHFLTSEPAIWSNTVTSCSIVTHAGLNVLTVLCQQCLYIYLI